MKECYTFHHLHYGPRLANFSPRPAEHWFTYTELCKLGRQARFANFYSLLDVVEASDVFIVRNVIRRWLIPLWKYRPWLKAMVLSQSGSSILMMKRH